MAYRHATLLFTIIGLTSASHLLKYSGPGPDWARNRTHAVSNDGPIKRILASDKRSLQSVTWLLNHFEDISTEMIRLRKQGYAKTARQTMCNVEDNSVKWYQLSSRLKPYGFAPYRSRCITDLDIGKASDVLLKIEDLTAVLRKRSKQIIKGAGVGWKNGFYFSNFTYNTFAQTCSLHYVSAVRVHKQWALFTSLTRFDRTNNTLNRGRPFLDELIGARKGKLINLPIHAQHAKYGKESIVTTVESFWDGVPLPTIFGVLPNYRGRDLGENPAISAAMQSSAQWLEQVEFSFNTSNISIMGLSCIMAFIPLSFFHEAKLHAVFFYVLFTDVFACAPLVIKGVELIDFSMQTHQAVRSRVFGLDYQLDLGVAEVYAANCTTPNNVYWTGMKFVICGTFAVVFGVLLEVGMLLRVRKRKDRRKRLAQADRIWAKSTTCTLCLCTHSLFDQDEGASRAGNLLFRIPSRRLPPYRMNEGWSGVISV